MNLTILTDYLQAEGVGTNGVDLFAHRMPFECQKGVLLRLPLDGIQRDPQLPGYFKTEGLQAIIRDIDQAAGEIKAQRVMDALDLMNHQFEGLKINRIFARTLPVVYPRSDGQELEWSITFFASYVQPGA
jgi:hypothetical protein